MTSCLFVTMFCGKLHVPSGEIIYSNGGHNPPYVLRCHGSLEPLPRVGGPALGLSDAATYRLGRLTLQPQDALVLYTDGVTEATSPDEEFFLESRLEACVRTAPGETARQLVERVSRAVEEFTAGAPPPTTSPSWRCATAARRMAAERMRHDALDLSHARQPAI